MHGSNKKKRPNASPQESVREHALRLLDFRPRTKKELSDRLKSKGYSKSLVESLLERFDELGLLDDRRFAVDRARAMLLKKGWGPKKLMVDLFRRGVPEDIIRESIELAYSDVTQEELIVREVTKRFGPEILDVDSNEYRVRNKAFRFLLGRGFESEKVKSVLGYY